MGLVAQEQPEDFSGRGGRLGSVSEIEDVEDQSRTQAIGKAISKGLVGLAVGTFLGYCAYSGQRPDEAVAAIMAADPQQFLKDAIVYIDSLGPLGYLYFSAIYVVAEMLAIPAIPLTASAGYLFGVPMGTAVVLVSATIAAGAAFLVGRLFLRQFVEGIIGGSRKFAAIDEAVSRKGFQLVLLLRLSPLLPFALSNYLYGMTKVKFGEYIGGTLIGFAPGSLAFVLSGKLGRELLDVSSGAGEGGVSQLHVPWYGYVVGIAGLLGIVKVVAGIAAKEIKEVEDEFAEKRRAERRVAQGAAIASMQEEASRKL